jgi:hypothetical protein
MVYYIFNFINRYNFDSLIFTYLNSEADTLWIHYPRWYWASFYRVFFHAFFFSAPVSISESGRKVRAPPGRVLGNAQEG